MYNFSPPETYLVVCVINCMIVVNENLVNRVSDKSRETFLNTDVLDIINACARVHLMMNDFLQRLVQFK